MNPGPPAGERRGRVVLGLGAAGVIAACVAGAARRLGDFDLPWHLATGRALVLRRSIPATDDFSYTFQGAPLRGEYLSDAVLYLAERLAGAAGLHCVALVALLGLSALLVARAGGGRAGFAAAGLALIASGPWLVLRPALLSMVALAALLLVIDRHRLRPTGSRLLALVPLQLAWANVHGLAALGAVIAVGYGAHRCVCRLLAGRVGGLFPPGEGTGVGHTVAIVALAVCATCASSYGPGVFTNPLLLRSYATAITEWAPTTPGFVLHYAPAFGLLALVALASLIARPAGSRGAPAAFDVALLLGSLALALLHVRLIPVFAIAAAPLVARRLAPELERARTGPALALVIAVLAAPALLLAPGARPGFGWDAENLPVGAADFAATHKPRGRLWNFLPFGGWVTWRLGPPTRVFIDGRTGWLYPPEFVDGYFRGQRDPAAFAALQQEWGFSWALARARPGERFDLPLAADAAWRMVYLDDSAAVYVRLGGPDAALAGDGYRLLRHLSDAPGLLARFADPHAPAPPEAVAALAHDAALAVAQAPRSVRARFTVVVSALARGDGAAARVALEELRRLAPDYPGLALLASAIPADQVIAP